MKIRHSFLRWLKSRSSVQLIVLFYVIAVVLSTVILSLPFTHMPNIHMSFIDLLFVAVSAISVTGLTPVSIVDTFNTTGYISIMFILEIGGIGVMGMGTLIWLLLGKKIGLKERRLIMADQNQSQFSGMVRLVKQIIRLILIIEFIGFIILGTYYIPYFPTVGEAYLQGLFASVSATTNAGFDITGQSLIPFRHDYFVQFIQMILIIFGSIGFPVLVEVKEYIFAKKEEQKFLRFSLFTKVTTSTFALLIVVGASLIALLDMGHFFKGMSWHEIVFYSLFQSVTTKSAGLTTMDLSMLTDQNQLVMSFLMFIGASPSSTGGGIRTTTFALVVIFMISYIRGGRNIHIFRREVLQDDLMKAVTVTLTAIMLVFSSIIIITTIEPFSLNEVIFEVSSAFGTVGASLGITSDLTVISKIILMCLMFIGRVGVMTFLFTFRKKNDLAKYHYPKEKLIIG